MSMTKKMVKRVAVISYNLQEITNIISEKGQGE